MSSHIAIQGFASRRFERVADAFQRNFDTNAEAGASVCVYFGGERVVDLWAGFADRATEKPWQQDTLALVFSATKGVTAACVLMLAERGVLDVDTPVAGYWPEFAAAGKAEIPLRWVLSHRAGLPLVEADLSTEQVLAWHPVVEAIAIQRPMWPPGSQHGYHTRTYGFILGEVVRRVTGVSLGRVLAREIAEPLGLDFHIGLPQALEPRVATTYAAEPPTDAEERAIRDQFMGPGTLLHRALNGPGQLAYGDVWNERRVHTAELPSSNGIGDARSLAKLYAALIGPIEGRRILRRETIAAACEVQSEGPDAILAGMPTRFGLGFMLPPMLSPGCAPSCFGHPGAGGSVAFADPARGLSFAYVMNQMRLSLTPDERSAGLIRATYEAMA